MPIRLRFARIGACLGLALISLPILTTPATARDKAPAADPAGEAKLAKMLQGRVPGQPVDCINLTQARSSSVIDKTAIVYDDGSTLYVNRPSGHESLDSDDVLVTKTWSSQLCRLDIVELHDRAGMWWRGSVGLESFVPYSRPRKGSAPSPTPTSTPMATSGGTDHPAN